MFKKLNKKNAMYFVTLGFIFGVVIFFAVFGNLGEKTRENKIEEPQREVQSLSEAQWVSYQGELGKDALLLLKEKATVETDASGLVVAINGRKADAAKREYWAFYINGTLAQVGPAQYSTTDQDTIEWKIEQY